MLAGSLKISTPSLRWLCLLVCASTLAIAQASAAPVIDGKVSPGEYDAEKVFGGGSYKIYWSILGEEIYFGIEGDTSGWVSIGIEPSQSMKDADIIMGWVDDGKVTVLDTFSTGLLGPHPDDVSLGGSSSILESAGSEAGGITTIEFRRLLVTGDQFDQDIPKNGEVSVIWGIASRDDSERKHNKKGGGALTMAVPEPALLLLASLCMLGLMRLD